MTPVASSTFDRTGPVLAEPEATCFVLWRDFDPRERGGVLGLVDDVLDHIVRNRLRLHWTPSGVTEFAMDGTESRTYEFGFRNSVARAVIARLAFLCDDEKKRDPIYPYRGVGSFTDPRWPHVVIHVDFNNTQADQRLELTPVFASESK